MDYFVCESNIPYYQWQLSLLIESFKRLNIEDKLVVCLSSKRDNPLIIDKKFVENISKHKRLCLFEGFGKERGYQPLDKFYSLVYCLKNKIVKQPFLMFLEPDIVIKKELNIVPSEEVPDFLYVYDKDFTFQIAEEKYPNFWDVLKVDKKICEKTWTNIGDIAVFSNVPEVFFDRVIYTAENLVQLFVKEIYRPEILKLALSLTLSEVYPKIRLNKSINSVIPVTSFGDSNFLSYKNGILPEFHKCMFKYFPKLFAMGHPLETLSKICTCPNTKYLADLANNMLD